MKNLLRIFLVLAFALASASCYDDSVINGKIESLESRVSALETQVNTNVKAIQTLVSAIDKMESITSCTALEDGSGYSITFTSGKSITVYNGKDGATPSISVRMDSDGIYYWTVNGEYLTVGGKKIRAESVAPRFKITDNYWYVSTDNGQTWNKIGKAMEETFVIRSINVIGDEVVFVLGDGTTFRIPVASGSDASAIKNLTYVPEYADGAARLFSLDGTNYGELRFEVTPAELVSSLEEREDLKWTVKAHYTKTKAAAGDDASLEVYKVVFQGSYIRVKVRTKDSVPTVDAELGLNASLRVSDSLGTYTSDYLRVVYGGEKQISKEFDQTRIALSLGVISDVHINLGDGTTSTKFVSALNQLKDKAAEKDADGIDAVLVDGDLIDSQGNTAQLAEFKSKYESVFDPTEVPMIYTPGNHEVAWNTSAVANVAFMRNGFGSDYFLTDKDPEAGTSMECRHCVVGDCNILTIFPSGTGPVVYSAAAKSWLDTKLQTITEKDPNNYVIVLTHPMIYGTVYGSLLGWESGEWSGSGVSNMWSTKDLTSILEKYPQAIIFGGHLHFPLNDPRSIWQGNFTAFGCSSVRYMALECGGYDTMKTVTTLTDAHSVSQGHLLQIDENGNVRVTRMDFSKKAVIGTPYDLSYPVSTKEHLATYSSSARSLANEAPSEPVATVTTESGVTSVTFGATDDEFVHDFSLTLTKGGETIKTIKVITDFYLNPQTSTMAKTYTRQLGSLGNGNFTLTVVARDSWGKTSTLEKSFTIQGPMTVWTKDDAGSKAVEGGEGTVSGNWLSYNNGTLSWTENTTGKPRTETITLPSSATCTVSQLEADDFKGTWTLYSKKFYNGGSSKKDSDDCSVTFANPLVTDALTDENGKSHTNNIGIKGLYLNSVMDACVEIDYENQNISFGVFFDRRSALDAGNGNWCAYVPECNTGNTWESTKYVFAPTDFSANNYEWLWFYSVGNNFDTFKWVYGGSTRKMNGKYYIVGISIIKATSSSASSLESNYNTIYQANYGGAAASGMYFKRN